eukprot:TRINITY_DN6059_c0_g1_i3.p1 TRINITY_DN6059_c0_g1~~TRINITY_DN6059_c0_g1_i3.p1  ORF type:complete len:174 (-),score=13.35 TRINITY_DN6059_c0_g1_i3:13-534(-)
MTSSFNDDETCMAKLRVWKTFFELYAEVPNLRRCSSEPASELASCSRLSSIPRCVTSTHGETSGAVTASPLNDSNGTAPLDTGSVELTDKLRSGDKTVLFRNIPCKIGYERIMRELSHVGLDGRYDFLYLPKSVRVVNGLKASVGACSQIGEGFAKDKSSSARLILSRSISDA